MNQQRNPWDTEKYNLIFNRDENVCAYCGIDTNLALDHIVPISRGGDDTAANLVVSCKSCNSSKGGRRLLGLFEKQMLESVRIKNTRFGIDPQMVCTVYKDHVEYDVWGYSLSVEGIPEIRWGGSGKKKYHRKRFNRTVLTYETNAGVMIPGIMSAIDIFTMIYLQEQESDPPSMKTIEKYVQRRDRAFKSFCEQFGLVVYERGEESVCSGCYVKDWFSVKHWNDAEEEKQLVYGMNLFLHDYRIADEEQKIWMQDELQVSIMRLVSEVNNGKQVDARYE